MSNRALGLVREALTTAGMELSYAYEDLIFLEHNGFLLQFTDNEAELLIHTNSDANEDEVAGAIALLQVKATEVGLTFNRRGRYRLTQVEGEEKIQLQFC